MPSIWTFSIPPVFKLFEEYWVGAGWAQYLMLECDKLNYILQQQDGDSRVTIHLYIKRNKEYMAQITNYIYRLVKK